jgi:hypothetical protein
MSVGILRALSSARTCVRFGLLLAVGGLLSACGGGGGGDGGGGNDATYSLSTSTVTFSAIQGAAAPASRIVTVNVTNGTVFIGTSQSANGFVHVFQLTGPNTGEIAITPDTPASAGTFGGTITVRGCSTANCSGGDVSGSPKVINVIYTVSPLSVLSSTPAAVDFLTSTGVAPASKSVALGLSTGPGIFSSSIVYNSGSSGWLVVTPSGVVPGTATISVSPVPPAGTHTATATFTAGGVSTAVPVTITVKDPTANFVSPYVATSGAGDVIIRGYGFSAVTTGLQVFFDTNLATSATVVSDTEIRASYSGLTVGSYPITVRNGSLTLPSRAELKLVVVNPPNFGAFSVARNAGVSRLIYDAERRAIYLTGDGIERYGFNGTSWIKTALGLGFSLNFITLAPDGSELISANISRIARIDPVTFFPLSLENAVSLVGSGSVYLADIAFANDGTAIGAINLPTLGNPSLYRYDMLTRQFDVLSTLSATSDLGRRIVSASGDGSRLVLPFNDSSASRNIVLYAAGDRSQTEVSAVTSSTTQASQSRTGSRVILTSFDSMPSQVTTVYDNSFNILGTLPNDLQGVVISPDGSKAYAYFSATGTIRKFDLNAPDGSGGFTEIGTGTLVGSVPGTGFQQMALSPDGGSLFMAGNQSFIVMPAP